ncbi:PF10972 family protein [SAR86 cluster bacterium SAR86E]|uniref:PF10972 family protein n=1 Tax=SAR86 cluster bacterium SAR86E TaxID=1208365 RepID=K6H352_9GAMM|nr:PF10972 family protein [SAR86 cluster bacterium SAR86E]
MSSFRSFISLLIFSLSVVAQSESPEEYMIEVIVFEQLEIIGNEKLEPQDINLINLNTITLLKKPDIVLNEKTILKSFDFDETDLIIDQLIIDKNKKEQIQASDPPISRKKINESKWYERHQSLDQLDNIYRRLDRRKEYRILHKLSWLQPALKRNESPFVHEIFDDNGLLIKLYKSRYLHLDVIAYLEGNLRTDNNPDLIREIKFDALKNSIPDDVKSYEIKISDKIKNSNEIYNHNQETTQANTDQIKTIEVGKVKYLLDEERRIFKNESHYFDHPKIGIIISVYDSSL